MSQLLAPYNDSMRLGMGYNSYTQTMCIDNAVKVPVHDSLRFSGDGMGPSQSVTYSSKFASTLSEVVGAMNISYSSSIRKGTVEVAGNSSQIDENKIKTSDINCVVNVKVVNQTATLKEEHCVFRHLPAQSRVEPGSQEFNDIFGDSYISGWIEGGEFNAVLSMQVINRTETKEIVDAIRQSLGNSSTSNATEFSMRLKNFSSGSVGSNVMNRTETTISIGWMGGGQIKHPDRAWDRKSVFATAAAFPAMVASCPQKTWAILTKYKTNRSYRMWAAAQRISPLDYDLVGSYTAELFENYMEYKQLIKQLQGIMHEASEYTARTDVKNPIGPDVPTLAAVGSAMRMEMAKIVAAVDVLAIDPKSLQRNARARFRQTPINPVVASILESILGPQSQPTKPEKPAKPANYDSSDEDISGDGSADEGMVKPNQQDTTSDMDGPEIIADTELDPSLALPVRVTVAKESSANAPSTSTDADRSGTAAEESSGTLPADYTADKPLSDPANNNDSLPDSFDDVKPNDAANGNDKSKDSLPDNFDDITPDKSTNKDKEDDAPLFDDGSNSGIPDNAKGGASRPSNGEDSRGRLPRPDDNKTRKGEDKATDDSHKPAPRRPRRRRVRKDFPFESLVAPDIWRDALPVKKAEVVPLPPVVDGSKDASKLLKFVDPGPYDTDPAEHVLGPPVPSPVPPTHQDIRDATSDLDLKDNAGALQYCIAIANSADVMRSFKTFAQAKSRVLITGEDVLTLATPVGSQPVTSAWLLVVYRASNAPWRYLFAKGRKGVSWSWTIGDRSLNHQSQDDIGSFVDRTLVLTQWSEVPGSICFVVRDDTLHDSDQVRTAMVNQIKATFEKDHITANLEFHRRIDALSPLPEVGWTTQCSSALVIFQANLGRDICAAIDHGDGVSCWLHDPASLEVNEPGRLPAFSTRMFAWYRNGERLVYQDEAGFLQEAIRPAVSGNGLPSRWTVTRIETRAVVRRHSSFVVVAWADQARLYYVGSDNLIHEKCLDTTTGKWLADDGTSFPGDEVQKNSCLAVYKLRKFKGQDQNSEAVPAFGIIYSNKDGRHKVRCYYGTWTLVENPISSAPPNAPLAAAVNSKNDIAFVHQAGDGKICYQRTNHESGEINPFAPCWPLLPLDLSPNSLSIAAFTWPDVSGDAIKDGSQQDRPSDQMQLVLRTGPRGAGQLFQQTCQFDVGTVIASQAFAIQGQYTDEVAAQAWSRNKQVTSRIYVQEVGSRRILAMQMGDNGFVEEIPFFIY